MPSFNRVILAGNITRDPMLKQLPNGTSVCEFGIALNRKFKTANGEEREEVCFVDCSAFGKTSEVINQYMAKGKPIMLEGRLKYDSWEDKSGGGKRSKLSVIVDQFQFIGGKDNDGDDQPRQQSPAPTVGKHGMHPNNRPSRPGRGPDGPARVENPPWDNEPQFKEDDIPFNVPAGV